MYQTSEEWEKTFGDQLKQYRLRMNMSQAEAADRAGLSLGTITRAENGQGSSFATFIKLAQLYGKEPWFEAFAPQVSFSPLQQLEMGKQRERASKRKEA